MVHRQVKHFLQDIYNSSRFVDIIDRDGTSTLLEYSGGRYTLKYIRVKDSSTNKYHILSVPNDIRTCTEGIAWTFGMTPSEYNPIKET